MAVTDAYASAAEYRSAIAKSDVGDDAQIIIDLTAVSRYLERRLNRFFTRDTSAVVRIYDDEGGLPSIYVDDVVSVTSLKIDENMDGAYELTIASTDYELLPRNAADGPEPSPYNEIALAPWGARTKFAHGSRIELTAVFGWPSVPAPIKSGCIQLTAILRLETPRASATVSELGQVVQSSPQARGIVDSLIKHYRKPAVA